MEFENAFDVPLPPADAWRTLLDIEKVAPCVPGAQLTDVVDDKTYKGKVSVRLGPVSLIFAGVVTFEEINPEKFFARASARGADAKGRGGADAKVQFTLEPVADGTRVLVKTILNLSGSIAQYGRASGVIRDIAGHITTEFANNLKAKINSEKAASPALQSEAGVVAANPISAGSLVFNLLRSWMRRIFGRSNAAPS